MIQLENTIISEEVLENDFVCNITKCKGECCVQGNSGAPLDEDELPILEEIYDRIKPYMRLSGIIAVEHQGKYVVDLEGDYTTPLIDNRECAYTIFDDNGAVKCGIEQAYLVGDIDWKKPISCHLYPIRVKEYKGFTAVNYDKWEICSKACELGKELEVPIYKFLKEALQRKFGGDWYKELELMAQELKKQKEIGKENK